MGTRLHVLLVEDSEDDAMLILAELRRAGYDPLPVRVDTAQALDAALDRRDWDLMIADYSMPSFTGLEALHLVRARGLDVPFIVVSGTIGEDVAVAAMKAGAHDYLIKDKLARLSPAVARELREAAERREHRRAEFALRESEDRYRRLVESSPEAILVNVGEAIAYVNEAGLRLFGAGSAEELVGKSILEIIHPDHRAGVSERIRQAQRDHQTLLREEIFLRLDGTPVNVEVAAAPFVLEGQTATQIFVRDISERTRADQALQQANVRLRSLSNRMLDVQENERRHIARELHDEIGQALTAVKLHLQAAQRRGGPETKQPLEECVLITDQALDQVRNLSLNLRPSQLDDLGLVAALRWHIERQAAVSGLDAEFRADDLSERLEPALETACFRFVQEAFTNIVRHAGARRVWIEARQSNNGLRVSVRDDGKGFDVATALRNAILRGSMGLLGMQERVSLAGGKLNVSSRPGEGASVVAEFPLRFARPRARRTRRKDDDAGSSAAG
jgi:two-component system sensor histidine kinase UhpB